jgi:hypothetical protein
MAVTKSKLYGRCLNRKMIVFKITANEQGLLQDWNSLFVQPGTAAD